jgi:SAM-dependent methyltransferase
MPEWDCYDAGAETYAAAGEDDPAWRQRQRAAFAAMLAGGHVVADLGCGPGLDLAAFAAMGLETIGVDGSAAMLAIAARNAPASRLLREDVRRPLPACADGLWSMFTLLHLPESDLPACFTAWRGSVGRDTPLALGLVESEILRTRDVPNWLGQGRTCRFYYYPAACVRDWLIAAGWAVTDVVHDTPACYRGGVYDELKLSAYVIRAKATLLPDLQ